MKLHFTKIELITGYQRPNNSSNYNLLISRLSTGDEGENNIILSGLAG